jgi:ubiquinone/menaquinone biosynthesis C-methylase UbiE
MIVKDVTPREPATGPAPSTHVCPWWLGYLLCCPLRRLLESPEALLGPHVRPGMTVLEPGCGMGYFSLPLARMVGATGRVVCRDVQPKMLDGLLRRARRAGVSDRIEAVACAPGDLRLERWAARIDLAVAIHMVHEVADPVGLLDQLHAALRPGGGLLLLEPKGHVSESSFDATLAAASRAGFATLDRPGVRRSHAAMLAKREQGT